MLKGDDHMFRRYTVNENLSLQSLGAFLQPQFRSAVAHLPDKPEDDDYFYLRWLRAQKFDVAKAEDMLKKVGCLFVLFPKVNLYVQFQSHCTCSSKLP